MKNIKIKNDEIVISFKGLKNIIKILALLLLIISITFNVYFIFQYSKVKNNYCETDDLYVKIGDYYYNVCKQELRIVPSDSKVIYDTEVTGKINKDGTITKYK